MTTYCVYALIDPRDEIKKPFYIGMGGITRALQHAQNLDESVLEALHNTENQHLRADKDKTLESILCCADKAYSNRDICRVIIKYLDQEAAYAIESHLIDHFGLINLTNQVSGHHSDSFRWKNYKFDNENELLETVSGKYYVYGLVDPITGKPFYIGKGLRRRCFTHFSNIEKIEHGKHEKIRHYREAGHSDLDMLRILFCPADDRFNSDTIARAMESVMIMFTFGEANLTNRVGGCDVRNVRPHDLWEPIEGLDTRRILQPVGTPGIRTDEKEMAFLRPPGQLINLAHEKVIRTGRDSGILANGIITDTEYVDAGDPAFYIIPKDPNNPCKLKLFGRKSGLKCEIRRTKSKGWIEHFVNAGCSNFLREDLVLHPKGWIKRGRRINLNQDTDDTDIIEEEIRLGLNRAWILWELICLTDIAKASDALRAFLNDPSHIRP